MEQTSVKLKRLTLKNFKGIKSIVINFKDNTTIKGDNGTGKTTILDSFYWLLFDKEHTNRKDFSIKPLDSNGNIIPKIETEVEGVILVNKEETTLKKVYKEKWQKTRGKVNTEFKGNETLYFWNDVPLKKSEYQNKINTLLDDTLFKLISEPFAFSNLHWQKAREILTTIVGDVTEKDVTKGNPKYDTLIKKISNKSLQEFLAEIKFKKKGLNDEIKEIPTRIDEVYNNMPLLENEEELLAEKDKISEESVKISNKLNQVNESNKKFDELLYAHNEKLNQLKIEKSKVQYEIDNFKDDALEENQKEVSRLKSKNDFISEEITSLTNSINRIKTELEENQVEIDKAIKEKDQLLKQWQEENERKLMFSKDSFKCPTCNQPLKADDIEVEKDKMKKDFNQERAKTLNDIEEKGNRYKKSINMLVVRNEELKNNLSTKHKDLSFKKAELEKNIETLKKLESVGNSLKDKKATPPKSLLNKVKSFDKEMIKLIKEFTDSYKVKDTSDLNLKSSELHQSLNEVNNKLSIRKDIENSKERIKTLEENESKLAQKIADLEKEEFLAEEIQEKIINTIETKVNKLFELVDFKMFNTLVNGGNEPTCVPLINGVPFNDANTASKVNAGLDIINTLSKHFKIQTPIFIDNRESVVKLIPTNAQIINMYVSPEDKTLKIQ